ncbi:MAG: hypothetical protein HDS18_02950 [Bacteroides sp.]|nr:hypothetical protein [Bacteroides sp.]
MGSPRIMLPEGGFSQYLYCDHDGWATIELGGIKAKVVRNISDQDGLHTSLPMAAGTSEMYLRLDNFGNPVQARVYINRFSSLDFDWGHPHYNNPKKGGDGKVFPKGVVHIQEFTSESDGSGYRMSYNARYASEAEINKYGEILKAFNPKIKFR